MKYGPTFPECFASLGSARAFISEFVDWYNHEHQHSGIGFHTPANVHYGFAEGVAQRRSQTLAAARAKHPHRFGTTTDPKILALPESAWINDPAKRVKEKPSLMIIKLTLVPLDLKTSGARSRSYKVMTETPDRGTGPESLRKTDHEQGTQCGQPTFGSFRMAPIPYSHYQRLLSGSRVLPTVTEGAPGLDDAAGSSGLKMK